MNKKGDIPSLIYGIVMIFIVGVIIFFFSHSSGLFYDKIDTYLNTSDKYSGSVAERTIEEINVVEHGIWDYAFLGIIFGIILSLFLTAYATRISVVFFWLYAIISIVVLILGVILSNTWQEMASNPEFTETIARFPIMNAILGTKFPLFVAGIIFIMMILLFGKSPNETGGIIG